MRNGQTGSSEAVASFSTRRDLRATLGDFLDRGYGLHCEQSTERPYTAEVQEFAIGEVRLTDVRMSALTLSPRHRMQADEEYLYVKLVESGSLMLEQNGERCSLAAKSLVIVDPAVPFLERFDDATHLIVINCPKAALRARGLHSHFGHWVAPDMQSPDVKMVHDMIELVASHQLVLGKSTRALLGTQLIELIGVLVGSGDQTTTRSTMAAYFRVKRYIAQHLGDEALDAASIASGVGLSIGYLNRLFRDEGASLMRYLWRQRLDRACQILSASQGDGLRIEEIAWRCGFASAAHFSRRFRQRFDQTPSEWREHKSLASSES